MKKEIIGPIIYVFFAARLTYAVLHDTKSMFANKTTLWIVVIGIWIAAIWLSVKTVQWIRKRKKKK